MTKINEIIYNISKQTIKDKMEKVTEGLVSIQALSKELMKSVLGPYVQFDPEQQEFVFTEEWNKLNNNLKILTYLVGRKGISASGHLSDEEAVAPKTIADETYMPSGSVRYTLKILFEDHLINRTESSRYYVPSAKLLVVKGMVEKVGKEQTSGRAPIKGKKGRKVRKGVKEKRETSE